MTKEEFENNPLFDSLLEIYMPEMIDDFLNCYNKVKEELGDVFDITMEKVSVELFKAQELCEEGTTLLSATLLLLMTDSEEENSEQREEGNKNIKATFIWCILKGMR